MQTDGLSRSTLTSSPSRATWWRMVCEGSSTLAQHPEPSAGWESPAWWGLGSSVQLERGPERGRNSIVRVTQRSWGEDDERLWAPVALGGVMSTES